jgi:hypothetical protein
MARRVLDLSPGESRVSVTGPTTTAAVDVRRDVAETRQRGTIPATFATALDSTVGPALTSCPSGEPKVPRIGLRPGRVALARGNGPDPERWAGGPVTRRCAGSPWIEAGTRQAAPRHVRRRARWRLVVGQHGRAAANPDNPSVASNPAPSHVAASLKWDAPENGILTRQHAYGDVITAETRPDGTMCRDKGVAGRSGW